MEPSTKLDKALVLTLPAWPNYESLPNDTDMVPGPRK